MGGLSKVVYCDDALIVVDKPSGLLCVPGRGADKQDCLSARVQREYPDALVVHRLDMGTSGLFLMARSVQAQRTLGIAFAGREVRKRYVALVTGRMPASEGEIDLPLVADWPNRPRQKVDRDIGKPSRTLWRVIAYDEASDTTRVELEPVTGRSHQLRVHLMTIEHPILGDTLYATPAVQGLAARLMLHATQLELNHPASGKTLLFRSDPPF